jgi:hypothetical protein
MRLPLGWTCLLDGPTLRMDLPSGTDWLDNLPSSCSRTFQSTSSYCRPRHLVLQDSADGYFSVWSCLDVSLLLNITAGASIDANSGEPGGSSLPVIFSVVSLPWCLCNITPQKSVKSALPILSRHDHRICQLHQLCHVSRKVLFKKLHYANKLLRDQLNRHCRFAGMAFEATTLLQVVLLITWKCLSDTPVNQKHSYSVHFISSHAVLEEIAWTTSLVFATGLLDVLQAAAPPTIKYFKTLPTDTSKRWAVYLLVFEKPICRPKIYIGSGADGYRGIQDRFMHYRSGHALPARVEQALKEGYTIVHYGLLC